MKMLFTALERLERCAHGEDCVDADSTMREVRRTCSVLVDLAWEKLHTGDWKDVDEAWRDLYVLAAMAREDAGVASSPSETLRALDIASLLGGPTFRDGLERAIQRAHDEVTRPEREKHRKESQRKRRRDGDVGFRLGEDSLPDAFAELPPGALGDTARGFSRRAFPQDRTVSRASRGTGTKETKAETTTTTDETTMMDEATLRDVFFSSRSSIPTLDASPSLETFLTEHMMPGAPVILKGFAKTWPALEKWPDPEYLRAVAGARTVPVELGEHYMHESFAQDLIELGAFLDALAARGSGKRGDAKLEASRIGYVAQHALFDQIPALGLDVRIPEYCALTLHRDDDDASTAAEGEEKGEGNAGTRGGLWAVNAWLGPRGTVSPTHCDPTHNLLVQVVGRKYVRLYAPSTRDAMYLSEDAKERNSSLVDPRVSPWENFRNFPKFIRAPFSDAVLEPGDALYLPPGWFHYVQSVTSSFSVSHWWT